MCPNLGHITAAFPHFLHLFLLDGTIIAEVMIRYAVMGNMEYIKLWGGDSQYHPGSCVLSKRPARPAIPGI